MDDFTDGSPEPGPWAVIEVRRRHESFGRFRDYEVFLDDCPAARLGTAVPLLLQVEPGWHTLRAKMDWCWTQEAQIYAGPGEWATVVCGTSNEYRRLWNWPDTLFVAFGVPVLGMGLCLVKEVLPAWFGVAALLEGIFLAAMMIQRRQIWRGFRLFLPSRGPGAVIALEAPTDPGVAPPIGGNLDPDRTKPLR